MRARQKRLVQAILDDDEAEVRRVFSPRGQTISFGLRPQVAARTLCLHLAAFANSTRVARFLIDNGEQVNCQDGVGDTPLHVAARYNAWETADLLLDHGARTGMRNHAAQTPHDIAVGSGNHSVAELLRLADR